MIFLNINGGSLSAPQTKERVRGVKDSRIQVKKAEGWRVGGLEGWLNLYTSKLLIF